MYEELKHNYFPKHARTPTAATFLRGYPSGAPLTPHTGIPEVMPGAGVLPIPTPEFITTPVPEPICEPA